MPIGETGRALGLLAAVTIFAAACGGDDAARVTTIATTTSVAADTPQADSGSGDPVMDSRGLPPVDPLSVSGDIAVAGS